MKYLKYFKLYENFNLNENKSLTKEEFERILQEKCSDFKWEDRPIYRSISSNDSYLYVNSSYWSPKNSYKHDGVTYRKSMQGGYGKNYLHTPLINHLNSWSSYPKRQLICSTSMRTFMGYKNNLYRVIPFNGSNWGIVPNFDMHNIELSYEFSKLLSVLIGNKINQNIDINNISQLNMIRIPKSKEELIYPDDPINFETWMKSAAAGSAISIEDWEDVLEFCSKVDTADNSWVFSENPKKPLTIDVLNTLFSPESMGIKKMSYLEYKNSFGNLPSYENKENTYNDDEKIYDLKEPTPGHEIWTDSNVLLIRVDKIEEFYKKN
jgi:hypothetical protein